jgi:hypothetical protein
MVLGLDRLDVEGGFGNVQDAARVSRPRDSNSSEVGTAVATARRETKTAAKEIIVKYELGKAGEVEWVT